MQEGILNMKAKIIAGIGIFVLAFGLLFALKPKSFDKEFEKTMNDMNSYVLQGDMEITKGEDVKTYALEVGYKNVEDNDYFKVSLLDKELNQEQVILRNNEGVFVITPSLNQVFKFEGDWPMNSPKPYLLQSMLDIIAQENTEISKESDGTKITSDVIYPNNKNFIRQEMVFDKDLKVNWLQIFNQDNTPELKIVFHNVEYNNNLSDDYFIAPTTMQSSVSSNMITNDDLPLYPAQIYNSNLTSKSAMTNNGITKHILEFSGDRDFTVVETIRETSLQTQTVLMPGEMIDTLDVIGFYDGNQLSAIINGVEYTVFSDDLAPEEMMSVINSMQVAVMK